MRFLADFGFKRGFVVPIHSAGGLEAGVGMVGDKLDFPAETKPGLHLMALYTFDRVRQLVVTEAEELPSLTRGERRCSPGRPKESRLGKSARYCTSPKGLLTNTRGPLCASLARQTEPMP